MLLNIIAIDSADIYLAGKKKLELYYIYLYIFT